MNRNTQCDTCERCDFIFRIIVFAVLSMASTITYASAGDQRGNGGGGVVCRSAQGLISSVTTLDLYEAQLRDMDIDLDMTQTDPLRIVDQVLDRLARLDRKGAENYRALAHRFFDSTLSRFVTGIQLPFTEDTGPIALPIGCAIEQIVFQKEPAVPEDRLFLINRDLFSKLDAANQALLILHEVIYYELSHLTKNNSSGEPIRVHPTSFYARYFNERISSRSFETLSAEEFVKSFGMLSGSNDCYLNPNLHAIQWKGGFVDPCASKVEVLENITHFKTVFAPMNTKSTLLIGNVSLTVSASKATFENRDVIELEYDQSNKINSMHVIFHSADDDISFTAKGIPVVLRPYPSRSEGDRLSAVLVLQDDSDFQFVKEVAIDRSIADKFSVRIGSVEVKNYGSYFEPIHILFDSLSSSIHLSESWHYLASDKTWKIILDPKISIAQLKTLALTAASADVDIENSLSMHATLRIANARFTKEMWPVEPIQIYDEFSMPVTPNDVAIFKGELTLHNHKRVKTGVLSQEATLMTTEGVRKLFKAGTKLEFTETGECMTASDKKEAF